MKIITFNLLLFIATIFVANSQTAVAPANGDGSIANPYEISSIDNLYWIAEDTLNWDKNYIQVSDINAGETENWFSGKGFLPIGNVDVHFTGNYDGQNFTIDSLYINRSTDDYNGLFGCTYSGNLTNINLSNVNITGKNYTSAISGFVRDTTAIINCHAEGSVEGVSYVGGIAGWVKSYCMIEQCSFSGNVNGTLEVGGIAGYVYNHTTIKISYTRCFVTATGDKVGGIVGYMGYADIFDTYASSDISGNENVGGIAGQIYQSSIINCYSTSGIVGDSASTTGGLVGYDQGSSDVYSSFWNTSYGISVSDGGIGKTASEMFQICTYVDGIDASWDFIDENVNGTNDIWGMDNDYPFLAWEGGTNTEFCCAIENIDVSVSQSGNTLTANATGLSYQWMICNSTTIAGETNQSFTPSSSGDYAVIIENNHACVDTSSCYNIIVTNIKENFDIEAISLYPNPAHNQLTISTEQFVINNLEILDITGKQVKQLTMSNEQLTVDISNLQKGVYFIKTGNIINKFIKE
jgi:hypothetical protein